MRSESKPRLSIIIPTYMERENIERLVDALEKALADEKFEIIIVDDNSPDGTGEVAEKLAEMYGNIRVIHRFEKRGLSSAILDGIKNSRGKFICVMDADMQHPPEVVPKLLQVGVRGGDLVVASRYIDGGGVEGWSIARRIVSIVATLMARAIVKKARRVRDPLSGFFMFKREVINGVSLSPLGFKILLEVISKGRYRSIIEVPYIFKGRLKGRSKLSLREYLNYIKHLLKLLRES